VLFVDVVVGIYVDLADRTIDNESCNEYWSIPIPELEIMLKEYESGLREFSIKNPRIILKSRE
jgi:hypothetical protein